MRTKTHKQISKFYKVTLILALACQNKPHIQKHSLFKILTMIYMTIFLNTTRTFSRPSFLNKLYYKIYKC